MVCDVQVFVSLHPPAGCRGRVGNVLSVMSHRVRGSIHFDGGFHIPNESISSGGALIRKQLSEFNFRLQKLFFFFIFIEI